MCIFHFLNCRSGAKDSLSSRRRFIQSFLRLETVNPDNWRLKLKVSDAQKSFVADSATMLARAYAYRESRSKAYVIYNDMPDTPDDFVGDGNEGMFEFKKQMRL